MDEQIHFNYNILQATFHDDDAKHISEIFDDDEEGEEDLDDEDEEDSLLANNVR